MIYRAAVRLELATATDGEERVGEKKKKSVRMLKNLTDEKKAYLVLNKGKMVKVTNLFEPILQLDTKRCGGRQG